VHGVAGTTTKTPACTLPFRAAVEDSDFMRIEGSITSLSWIPSEAVTGLAKLPFATIAHYDQPPPNAIGGPGTTLDELRSRDRFRFANELRAFAEFAEDGTLTNCGYLSGGSIGSTTLGLGGKGTTVVAVALDDLQAEPESGPGWVRFTQTAGGRTGVPTPRTVRRPPFVQYHAPIAWSTLQLTLHADGRVESEVVGASPFPRHWVYDTDGVLVAKSGIINFKDWYQDAFGDHTPWGGLDSAALVTAVETALERELSLAIMRGGRSPSIRRYAVGDIICRQGDEESELFLVLDGVIAIEHDGRELAQFGPGTITGERSALEGGRRTSTNRAVTNVKVACVPAVDLDRDKLDQLATGHRREETLGGSPVS
jgi:Cyclic nucleotide-binding domain